MHLSADWEWTCAAAALLTSGQVGVCGWWHKMRARLWTRWTCSLFPHRGNRRMWRGTTLSKPTAMSSSCELWHVRRVNMALSQSLWRLRVRPVWLCAGTGNELLPPQQLSVYRQPAVTLQLHEGSCVTLKKKVSAHVRRFSSLFPSATHSRPQSVSITQEPLTANHRRAFESAEPFVQSSAGDSKFDSNPVSRPGPHCCAPRLVICTITAAGGSRRAAGSL